MIANSFLITVFIYAFFFTFFIGGCVSTFLMGVMLIEKHNRTKANIPMIAAAVCWVLAVIMDMFMV